MHRASTPLLFVVLLLLTAHAFAQTDPAALQALRSARASYEQGRLQELPTLLEGYLNKFTKAEKVEAYKLLVLTYIYLEEPEEADKAMLDLLRTDHFFEINEGTDPAEFINLYKKFRKDPIFAYGFRGSFLTTNINVQKHYHLFANAKGNGSYQSIQRIVGGLTFEKVVMRDKETLAPKLIAAPELFLSSRSFIYSNSNVFGTDNESQPTELVAEIRQRLVQLNLLGQYQFKRKMIKNLFQPYVGAGLATSYLLPKEGSTFLGELTVELDGNDVSGAKLDNTTNYKSLNFSAVLLLGAKVKVSELYLTADIRYYLGINNVVNRGNRYSQTGDNVEITQRYGYINNDFSINQAAISLGLVIPQFKPKKLIK